MTITLEDEAVSFGRRITELATAAPDAVAAVFAPRTGPDLLITRRTLDDRSTQVARLLAERGAGPGTLIAVGLPNSPEHLFTAIGAWKAGAGVLPVRADIPDWERDRLLDVAGVVLLVGDATGTRVPVVTRAEIAATVDRSVEPLADVVAVPAIAIASSGSTGRPKVIVSPLPGAAVPGATPPMPALYMDLPESMPQLIPAPLYHTNGFTVAHSTLFAGDTAVLMEKFDAAQAIDLIDRYRIACFTAVPTMLARMARVDGVHDRDLSCLVYVMYGGAPCPDWVVEAWFDLVGPERFFFTYGSSERVGLAMMRGDEWLTHRGSCGRGYKTLIRILDDEDHELGPGEIGEIFMHQPENPGPTFAYVGAEQPRRTPDGYTTIGDLGWLDDDGYLYIADRRVDMIVSGGANVFPAEVEAALSEHPGVQDVVVIGLPDPEWGRRVHAIIEPTDPAAPVTAPELDAFVRARLAAYKVPKDYELVAQMPRTDAGKINRGVLTEEREPAS
ncbi:MAG: AMP-binding protein [Acidimicrobiia bacterium]